MRLRSALAIAAVVPLSLVGCGSDDDTPDEPAVERETDGEELPEGDFVDPDLVDDPADSDVVGTIDEAPGEEPPAGD